MTVSFFDCGHDHGLEMFWLKDHDFIVVVFSLFMICVSAKKIHIFVGHTCFVVKSEVVLCQLHNPLFLVPVKLLGLSEILKILMGSPDFKILSSSHEVVPPFTEYKHDGEELLVIYFIVSFC